MSWVAVAIGGAAVLGAVVSSDSANNAANQQNQAANRSNAMAMSQFNQTREDQAPWRAAGGRALAGMENADFQRDFRTSDYMQDPGYQFRMQEGMKALEGSAAAKGSLNSGATLKALTRYGQNVASEEFTNARNRFVSDRDTRFNRLSSIAGLGQTANNQVGAAGQNYANAYGANTMGAGNANSAASIAQGNAINSAIGAGANTYVAMNSQPRAAAPQGPGMSGYGSAGGGAGGATYAKVGSNDSRRGDSQLTPAQLDARNMPQTAGDQLVGHFGMGAFGGGKGLANSNPYRGAFGGGLIAALPQNNYGFAPDAAANGLIEEGRPGTAGTAIAQEDAKSRERAEAEAVAVQDALRVANNYRRSLPFNRR